MHRRARLVLASSSMQFKAGVSRSYGGLSKEMRNVVLGRRRDRRHCPAGDEQRNPPGHMARLARVAHLASLKVVLRATAAQTAFVARLAQLAMCIEAMVRRVLALTLRDALDLLARAGFDAEQMRVTAAILGLTHGIAAGVQHNLLSFARGACGTRRASQWWVSVEATRWQSSVSDCLMSMLLLLLHTQDRTHIACSCSSCRRNQTNPVRTRA